MPTVKEILKASGFTDEKIAEMDANAIAAFGSMLTTAENDKKTAADSVAKAEADFKAAKEAVAKAEKDRAEAIAERERAELEKRSNLEFYETKVVPGLTGWDEEKVKLENARINAAAEAAFYKAQAEAAKTGGFIPNDAPKFEAPKVEPTRDGNGRYVAGGPGGTPGSPVFDTDTVIKRASDGFSMISDIDWRYKTLYGGAPLPIPPSQLIAEADAVKLSPRDYAERKFNFVAREQELNAQRQTERDAKLQSDAAAAKDAEWKAKMDAREAEILAEKKKVAENTGNNPDVRLPQGSARFTELKKAVDVGERPNPLKMTDAQRRAATRQAIHSEIQQREGAIA